MGLLENLLGRREEEEEFEEVSDIEEPAKHIMVRIENLQDYVDTERIARLVKEGNIVLVKAKELQRKDLAEFQNSVQKLKKFAMQHSWDIVGTEDGYVVLTPTFARIER